MKTIIERGWEMRKVKAKTTKLLESIKANYEQHKKDYAEAFAGYKLEAAEVIAAARKSVLAQLKELAEKVEAADMEKGDPPVSLGIAGPYFGKKVPQSHAASYEVVIKMLEYEVQEEIELTVEEFECYVMDRWDWKREFAATNAAYSNKLRSIGK